MKVIIHKDRQVFVTTTKLGNDLENNAEILEFKFPKELEDYSKYLEVDTSDGKYVTEIIDNQFRVANNLTKYNSVKMQVVCKDLSNNVTFKSDIFEVTIDNSINASEDIPQEQPELITQIQEDIYELQQNSAVQDSNYTHTDNNYTNAEKTKLANLENYDDTEIKADISNLQSNKANKSETYTKTQVNSLLDNKANINDIPDVSNFITNTVDNLVNYYKKTETYTQTEVNSLIGSIQQFHYEIVQTLPTTGANNIMYLVPKITSGTNNVYDEYVYANNSWEKIGSTDIDLSNYYTKAEVDTLLANIDLSNYYTKTQVDALIPDISGKQDTLVSGTNIKTINNESILGSGNITIQGGGGSEIYIGDEQDAPQGTKLVIDDGTVDFISTPENTYTTTEKRIGTWIDGKPIYRKVIATGNMSSSVPSQHNYSTGYTWSEINMIKLYGYIKGTDWAMPIGAEGNWGNTNFRLSMSGDGSIVIHQTSNQLGTDVANASGYIVIEYTKTTD